MNTRRLIICIVICLPVFAVAQSAREIQEKFPGEEAVVLNHSLHYTISIKDGQPQVQSDETQQILYLSVQAAAYMSKYGFSHSSFHELQSYEAYTKTADNRKIKVVDFKTSDSKSNSIFYDDVKETSFDFPAVGPGSVGTLQISMLHKDPHLLSPFFFSRSIPVVNSELKISFPKEMTVKYLMKGNDKDKIRVTEDSRHGETVYTFRVKDWPAEKGYEDEPDSRWFSPHVVFYIEKYKDENGQIVSWLASPDDLYHLYRGYLQHINKETGTDLRRIVDSLVANAPTPEEKARHIYSWVQQHIKYIAFEQGMEGFIPRDANLVCSRRFGDCKDMASILTLMLNTAGVPAYYTWIGTRGIPYTYTETPLPIVDNHMICTIRLDDRYIFLDATDPDCVFGMPSEGIQDKQALVAINDTAYKILQVPVPAAERNELVDSTVLELTDHGIKGNISLRLSGYYSMNMHGVLSYTKDKDLEKYLRNRFDRGSNKFKLGAFEIGELRDKDHVNIRAAFGLEDYAKKIGDEWYLNLNLFKFYDHEEIDYPRRKIPIEYNFYSKRKYVTVLKIPDGYQVSYQPDSKSYHNAVWGFDMTYEQKNHCLILTQEFDNGRLMLQPDQFQDWNKVLENLLPLYKETVSLSKK